MVEIFEVIGCIFLILCLCLSVAFALYDYRKTLKRLNEEVLRRETIKNALCDISKDLHIVAEHYVLKDIR